MTPHRSKVWSGRRFAIPFGEPLWSVVSGGTNMPIRNTTIKYANKVELNVATVNGVTGAVLTCRLGIPRSNTLTKSN